MKKYIVIYFIFNCAIVSGQHINKHVRQGNTLYKQGKFDLSLLEYQKSLESAPADPVTNYNLGNSLFRNSRFAEAADVFARSAESARDSDIAQKSYYNNGVALSKQKKLEESIAAYKKAVLLNTSDEDARVNLQKALLELKKKQPPEQQKENEQKKPQNKDEQKKQQPKSNLTKKQVEQLLKALQQREQQVQQKMQQHRNRSSGQQEKDW